MINKNEVKLAGKVQTLETKQNAIISHDR